MVRAIDAQSSIDLPVFSGASAATLGRRLLALLEEEKKLAENVMKSGAKLAERTHELEAEVRAAAAAKTNSGSGVRAARLAEASAWSAFESLPGGYRKLPSETPVAVIAERVYAALYAEGLSFLRLPMAPRWQETQRRVELLSQRALAADCVALGAQVFVTVIEERHAALGEAARITEAPQVDDAPAPGRALDAFKAALRCYVAQHVANAALDESGKAAAVSTRLLDPLARYESTRARSERALPSATDPAPPPNQ